MDQKLLKKLKKNKFPFTEHDDDSINKIYGYLPYSVTLSELIAACGDRFGHLESIFADGMRNPYIIGFVCSGAGMAVPKEIQDTPEAAVAELWLKINKK